MHLLPHVTQVGYLGRTHSDLHPQQLRLQWEVDLPPIPTWRLQPAALEDAHFHTSVGLEAEAFFEANTRTASSSLVEWDAFKVVMKGHCLGIQWSVRRQLDQ